MEEHPPCTISKLPLRAGVGPILVGGKPRSKGEEVISGLGGGFHALWQGGTGVKKPLLGFWPMSGPSFGGLRGPGKFPRIECRQNGE